MAIRTWTVLVDDGAGVPMETLVEALGRHGFVLERALSEIGVIVGRADESRVPAIRELRGVSAVEEEREIDLDLE